MNEETRHEIETLKNQLFELASSVRTIQALIQAHDHEINHLVDSVRSLSNVHS